MTHLPSSSAVAVLLILSGCGSAPHTAGTALAPAVGVTTATAVLMERRAVEMLPGTVKAALAATLMARVPGVVGRISASPGTAVAAGEVLVEIDAQELVARRHQAQAALATAHAAIAEARAALSEAAAAEKLAASDLARARRLLEQQALTQAEFDGAKARAQTAEARVEAADAQVAVAKQRKAEAEAAVAETEVMLGYTHLAAPFAGMVVRKHVAVGDLLAPGRPVLDLEDAASMRLEVEIPESLADRVVLGTRLQVQVAAAGFDREATVVEVTPAADPVSRSVLMKLALPADARGLHSGQFGRVAVATSGGPALMVPAGALVHRGQLDAVFVVSDGTARLRLVRSGGSAGALVAVRAGLAAGEMVVASGAETLADGQSVTVRPGPAAEGRP